MKKTIGVIDYGLVGNVFSICNAIENSGHKSLIIDSPKKLQKISRLILPGVGSFDEGMNEIIKSGFAETIINFQGPILGICLGMQLLCKIGFEGGSTQGLNLIDAEVKKIKCGFPVPHMGFNKIKVVNENQLLTGIEKEEFYFMHSYEVVNYTDISSLTEYGNHTFVSAIHKDNIFGVQFHPEKSRLAGIKLIDNFSKI